MGTDPAGTSSSVPQVAGRIPLTQETVAGGAPRSSDATERTRGAHAAATDAPDTRDRRVAAIKAQIEAGTYQVDNRALAETLLDVL